MSESEDFGSYFTKLKLEIRMADQNISDEGQYHQQEPQSDRLAISGRRRDVIFPPSVARLDAGYASSNGHTNHSVDMAGDMGGVQGGSALGAIQTQEIHFGGGTYESMSVGGQDGNDYSLLSMDIISLPSDRSSLPSNNASLAVSGLDTEASLNNLSGLYHLPDPAARMYVSAPVGDTPYQEAFVVCEDNPPRPHTPKEDSSPHSSLAQGNATCVAPSNSTRQHQVEYKRKKSYSFSDMTNFDKRLETFRTYEWPLSSPSPYKLANANMFYQGKLYLFLYLSKTVMVKLHSKFNMPSHNSEAFVFGFHALKSQCLVRYMYMPIHQTCACNSRRISFQVSVIVHSFDMTY